MPINVVNGRSDPNIRTGTLFAVGTANRDGFDRRRGFNGNGLSYLLLDTFSDTRPAGAVNGTLPDVGGARVVVDSNGKTSNAGGVADFATGGVGGGDPGRWYPSQARVLGKVLLGTIVNSDSGVRGADFGWDEDQVAAITDAFIFVQGGVLYIGQDSAGVIVGTWAVGSYQVALVMRATGMYYFIKGIAFTNWTLVWQSAVVSLSAFPGAEAFAATTTFTADNIRVPKDARFIPVPLAYSTFGA